MLPCALISRSCGSHVAWKNNLGSNCNISTLNLNTSMLQQIRPKFKSDPRIVESISLNSELICLPRSPQILLLCRLRIFHTWYFIEDGGGMLGKIIELQYQSAGWIYWMGAPLRTVDSGNGFYPRDFFSSSASHCQGLSADLDNTIQATLGYKQEPLVFVMV
jgi:hypothetical protein